MRKKTSGRTRGYWIALCAIAAVLVTAGTALASGPDAVGGEQGVLLAQVSPEQATPQALDLVQSVEDEQGPEVPPAMPLDDDDPMSPLNPEEDPMCGPDEVPYGDSCLPQPGGPGVQPMATGDCPDGHFPFQGMCHPLPQGFLPDAQ
ncbi:hypothetical protein [Oceanidesulfovibrio marinus]|uniref:hypothetical protein n=1 Tax=Oceanidesulfovibrio marinus TaxID=370038 RepID=UPI00148B0AE5|nr:hypothetical protein [Oceanidesulfovibrio marinus]